MTEDEMYRVRDKMYTEGKIAIGIVSMVAFLMIIILMAAKTRQDETMCIEGKLYNTYEYAPNMLSTVPVYGGDGRHLSCPQK